jgi:hypothetical protein
VGSSYIGVIDLQLTHFKKLSSQEVLIELFEVEFSKIAFGYSKHPHSYNFDIYYLTKISVPNITGKFVMYILKS